MQPSVFLNLCTNHDINLWNMDHKRRYLYLLHEFRRFPEDPSDGKENKDKDTDYKEMRIAIFFCTAIGKEKCFY